MEDLQTGGGKVERGPKKILGGAMPPPKKNFRFWISNSRILVILSAIFAVYLLIVQAKNTVFGRQRGAYPRPLDPPLSRSLFTNFKRRRSVSMPLYGTLITAILSLSYALNIIAIACWMHSSNILIELLVIDM